MGGLLTDAPESVVLLESLHRNGFEVCVQQDRLRVRPSDGLSEALRADLQRHKPALIALLAPVQEYVLLKGLTVPLPALQLLWSLEDRGFQMTLSTDEAFLVDPIDALTDVDRAGIHRWRRHLAALVALEPPEEMLQ